MRLQNGIPVLLRDVATVRVLPYLRQVAIIYDAPGEAVCGMVNPYEEVKRRAVDRRCKKRIASMKLLGLDSGPLLAVEAGRGLYSGHIAQPARNLIE